jgi:hypothetical protein
MLSSGLFPGSPKSLKIKIYMISVFTYNKYVVLKLWGQEEISHSTVCYIDVHISESYKNNHCAFIITIRGSWRRVGHFMWKAARNRHSPLGKSKLINIVLDALLSMHSPKGAAWLTKPVWILGEKRDFCTRRYSRPFILQVSKGQLVSRRFGLPDFVENQHIKM